MMEAGNTPAEKSGWAGAVLVRVRTIMMGQDPLLHRSEEGLEWAVLGLASGIRTNTSVKGGLSGPCLSLPNNDGGRVRTNKTGMEGWGLPCWACPMMMEAGRALTQQLGRLEWALIGLAH